MQVHESHAGEAGTANSSDTGYQTARVGTHSGDGNVQAEQSNSAIIRCIQTDCTHLMYNFMCNLIVI